ncbi:hypothetical protein GMA92_06955 [Turicibacter sanguinis]|jgi:hypothetical protein|uniref:Uncharacterized protein n=3 Tax=Turicibacteraceae TaxID=2810281 RepID=A0A9X4XH65_9FIRM|nr:hypothetical protein CUW_1551 [Turicibacter sanguinis PC909]EGC92918.1 hypothetical protein HMPREF9402_1606 [Turicibacter sp. HGF1]KAA3384420.1 hypothetical protein F1909_11915 [Akkermansia muciniphila]MBP3903166.1 hypothetical protein [Turicibacter sp.]MTH06678.1 hypothetical protein [Turicibacter sanguinis]
MMDVLKDEQLEAQGLITEIDTLKIIRVANELKLQRQRKRLKILMMIAGVFCVLAQMLIFKFIGFNREFIMLGGIYVLFASLILLIVRYREGGNI